MGPTGPAGGPTGPTGPTGAAGSTGPSGGPLPPLIGQQFAVLMENPIGTVSWGRLTQDMILPGFSITSFVGGSTVDLGATVNNPSFAATYSGTPTSASVVDNQGNPSLNVSGTPNSFSYPHSYTRSGPATVSWTLTASPSGGFPVDNATTTTTWSSRSYFGAGPPGSTGAAFILSLNNHFETSRADVFTADGGSTPANQKIYYASPSRFGPATFTIGQFSGGFFLAQAGVAVTGPFGVVENYDLYESDNVGLGVITVTVS